MKTKKPTQDFCLILCVDHLRRDFYTFYAGFHGSCFFHTQKTSNQAGAHGKIVPRTLNLRRSTLNLLDSPFYHVSVRTHTSGRWKTRKNMLLSTCFESWWRWNLNSLVWFVGWCTRKKDENVARPRKYAFESWLGGDVDGFTQKIDENVARPRKYAFESWLGDVVVWFLAKYAIKNGKNLAENEKQWKPKNLRKIFA